MFVSIGFPRGVVGERTAPCSRRRAFFAVFLAAMIFLFVPASLSRAQIGGKTASDGPFTVDNVEDLNLVSETLGRNWVSDYLPYTGNVLSTLTLASSGLTLAPGQTPLGALKCTVPARYNQRFGYIGGGFGIPVPAVPGASTAVFPGNIASFETLSFLACFQPLLDGQKFQVMLETYPEREPGVFPKIYWVFSPALGTAFQKVNLSLRHPTFIENGEGLTLEEMLSQTRFLYFYCYAAPVTIGTTLTLRMDDIRLEGEFTPAEELSSRGWELYE